MNRRKFLATLAALPVVGKYARVYIKDASYDDFESASALIVETMPPKSPTRTATGVASQQWSAYNRASMFVWDRDSEDWILKSPIRPLEPDDYIPAMWREDV